MANIRKTVEHVCVVLSDFGIDYVSAEVLRKAKYNKPEPIPTLWRLLHDMIVLHECDGFSFPREECRKILDTGWESLYLKDPDFAYYFVKYELEKMGMNVGKDSSRSLLLAFGLIMQAADLFGKWTHRQLQCNDTAKDLMDLPPYKEDTMHSIKHASTAGGKASLANEAVVRGLSGVHGLSKPKQMSAIINILHSMIGRMDAVVREIRSRQRERHVLQHKIRVLTKDVERPEQGVILTRDHMSMFEVYLLRHKKQYMAHLQHLEATNEKANFVLESQEHHMIFWAWLQSALDEEPPPDAGAIGDAVGQLNSVKQEVVDQVRDANVSGTITPLWSKVCRQRKVMALVDELVDEEDSIVATVQAPCAHPPSCKPKQRSSHLHIVCQCAPSKNHTSRETSKKTNSCDSRESVQWTLLPPPKSRRHETSSSASGPPISSYIQQHALQEVLARLEQELRLNEQESEILLQQLREPREDIAVIDTPP